MLYPLELVRFTTVLLSVWKYEPWIVYARVVPRYITWGVMAVMEGAGTFAMANRSDFVDVPPSSVVTVIFQAPVAALAGISKPPMIRVGVME